MKRRLVLGITAVILCFSLTGCKSADYKKAAEYQASGDYSSALELFESLPGYKDSDDRAAQCRTMLAAIEAFENAKVSAEEKNRTLDAAISDVEALIAEGRKALDDAAVPALETAISEAKAAKVPIREMPAAAEEIEAAAASMEAVDYSAITNQLLERKDALEVSIKQYALVDAPSEAYIIQCLGRVPDVTGISAVTEDNDPNQNLNKAGGYTAQVYFSSALVDQSAMYGETIIEKGTTCGGSIEVYATPEDAESRNGYLSTFDGSFLSSGSHTVVGTVLVRTSRKLTASQQKQLEADIISALTAVEG